MSHKVNHYIDSVELRSQGLVSSINLEVVAGTDGFDNVPLPRVSQLNRTREE